MSQSEPPRGLHDVIVIGGGITGAGVGRDLALRGLSVLLVERGDWGGGASTELLHGGARSAELDRDEAGRLQRVAGHLARRCVAMVPSLPDGGPGLDAIESALRGSRQCERLTGDEARRLEPGLPAHVAAALTVVDWSVDGHRLAWANVLDAARAGARALNHTRAVALLRDGAAVVGVRLRGPDGARSEVRARVVVNAAGPRAPEVAALAGATLRLRSTRHVQVVYDRQIAAVAISADAVDGREVRLVPHGGATFLGAVAGDHHGDLDALEVLPGDVDHLLQAAERVLPAIREHRPVRARAAVRPAPFRWRTPADALLRRFEVIEHDRRDGVAGLVTVVGGPVAQYRLAAERAADAVCARLGGGARAAAVDRPLPGGNGVAPPVRALAAEHGITALAAARILGRHGAEAPEVLQDPRRGRLVCRCEALTEAELVHAARHEQVRTLADAFRRVGLAAGPCAGAACVERAAEVLGQELGWSPSQRREAGRDYLTGAWRGRAPVLDRWGWAQEELAYGARRGWPGGL